MADCHNMFYCFGPKPYWHHCRHPPASSAVSACILYRIRKPLINTPEPTYHLCDFRNYVARFKPCRYGAPAACVEQQALTYAPPLQIGDLQGDQVQQVVEIVSEALGSVDETGEGEIELDIDALPNAVLWRLREYVDSLLSVHVEAKPARVGPDKAPPSVNGDASKASKAAVKESKAASVKDDSDTSSTSCGVRAVCHVRLACCCSGAALHHQLQQGGGVRDLCGVCLL